MDYEEHEVSTIQVFARHHDGDPALWLDGDTLNATDARLIDAASDLLAASRDALESLRRLPSTPDAYRVTCISQLESAIAKATGGQS